MDMGVDPLLDSAPLADIGPPARVVEDRAPRGGGW